MWCKCPVFFFYLCWWLPVWASASSKRWHFKIVLRHDSCIYALVLLFSIICLVLPTSHCLSLSKQGSASDWLLLLKQVPVAEGRWASLSFPPLIPVRSLSFPLFLSLSVYIRHLTMLVASFWFCWITDPTQVERKTVYNTGWTTTLKKTFIGPTELISFSFASTRSKFTTKKIQL